MNTIAPATFGFNYDLDAPQAPLFTPTNEAAFMNPANYNMVYHLDQVDESSSHIPQAKLGDGLVEMGLGEVRVQGDRPVEACQRILRALDAVEDAATIAMGFRIIRIDLQRAPQSMGNVHFDLPFDCCLFADAGRALGVSCFIASPSVSLVENSPAIASADSAPSG